MATREEYNACMRPFISGKGKSKEERKRSFCIGAKVCSGKAQSEEQGAELCSNIGNQKQINRKVESNPCGSIIPMGAWIQQSSEDSGVCRPCLLGPVTGWYVDVLRNAGQQDLATALEGAVGQGEVAVAEKLDEIKGVVSPELSARLKEFDCHAQLYKGE